MGREPVSFSRLLWSTTSRSN